MVKNTSTSAGDVGSVLGPGRFHVVQGDKAYAPQLLEPALPRVYASAREATTRRSLHPATRE